MADISIPKLDVDVNYYDNWISSYSLYVNGEYEGTYMTKTDLQIRIGYIIVSEINKVVEK